MVPIVQGVGWAAGTDCTGAERLTLTGFRFPDRPGRSESLYQLSYPGSQGYFGNVYKIIIIHIFLESIKTRMSNNFR